MRRKEFDKKLRALALSDNLQVPDSVKMSIDKTLEGLPDKEKRHFKGYAMRTVLAATCAVFILLFVMPNVSPAYAEALKDVPIIGDIVKVFTIRDDEYSDDYHELKANVPLIEDKENEAAAELINKDIAELTDRIISEFYKELEAVGDNGHSSVYIDYEIMRDTKRWFSLKLSVCQAAGSGNIYYRYYHIDRESGEYVKLSDMFKDDSYRQVLAEEIRSQMRERMTGDSQKVYWIDGNGIGYEFTILDADQEFFFDDDGNLVIVFDKYEVTPGYMGCPEFTIPKEVYSNLLKDEFRDIY